MSKSRRIGRVSICSNPDLQILQVPNAMGIFVYCCLQSWTDVGGLGLLLHVIFLLVLKTKISHLNEERLIRSSQALRVSTAEMSVDQPVVGQVTVNS